MNEYGLTDFEAGLLALCRRARLLPPSVRMVRQLARDSGKYAECTEAEARAVFKEMF